MTIWEILHIGPTDNERDIKRAYAKLARDIDPDEQMSEFLELRNAYEKALVLAENKEFFSENIIKLKETTLTEKNEETQESNTQTNEHQETELETEQTTNSNQYSEQETAKEQEPKPLIQLDFINTADAHYINCEAMLEFKKLYFEKKIKDQNVWIKYINSPVFLGVYKEKGFIVALVQTLNEAFAQNNKNKAFLELLPLIYCLIKVSERNPTPHNINVDFTFDGFDEISAFINSYGGARRIKNNTHYAIMKSFEDFTAFNQLISANVWNDNIAHSMGMLIGRYVSAYLNDKIPNNKSYLEDYNALPRHVSSLEMLNYFFSTANLPKQAYLILWGKLNLQSATMGKNKLWYGRLRDIVIEHCPELIAPKVDELSCENLSESSGDNLNLKEILQQITPFFVSLLKLDDENRYKLLDEFFAKDDIKKAMTNQKFVEQRVLNIWTGKNTAYYRLEHLINYCQKNEDVWLRDTIIELSTNSLKAQKIQKAYDEDFYYSAQNHETMQGERAFFRYFFYAAFPYAQSMQAGGNLRNSEHEQTSNFTTLRQILADEFAHSLTWVEGYLGYDTKTNSYKTPHGNNINIGEHNIEIIFHCAYVEYLFNGKEVLAPNVPFNVIENIDDEMLFWLLLPITFEETNKSDAVYQNILQRLNKMPFLKGLSTDEMANCLTDAVCSLKNADNTPQILRLKKESYLNLYTAEIFTQNGYVRIISSSATESAKVLIQDNFESLDSALNFASEQLNLYTKAYDLDKLSLEKLPVEIVESIVKRKAITCEPTLENVIKHLKLFQNGLSSRVEFCFSGRRLIFISDNEKYACFIFDTGKRYRYSLLANPAIYQFVDSKDVVWEDFLYGKLPNYLIHKTAHSILNKINEIFADASSNADPRGMWSTNVYYLKDKQFMIELRTIGGMTIPLGGQTPFYLNNYPIMLEWQKQNSEKETLKITQMHRQKVQDMLYLYLRGDLKQLTLTWAQNCSKELNAPLQHIHLICENNKYALLYRSDEKPQLLALTANIDDTTCDKLSENEQLEISGFNLYDYQIHTKTDVVRGYLDILLATIENPEKLLNTHGEFSVIPNQQNLTYVCFL